ncbi:MAG: hypothetical protein R3C28_06355 [Pirellulaceae bacterium]
MRLLATMMNSILMAVFTGTPSAQTLSAECSAPAILILFRTKRLAMRELAPYLLGAVDCAILEPGWTSIANHVCFGSARLLEFNCEPFGTARLLARWASDTCSQPLIFAAKNCVRLQQGDYGRETVFGDDPRPWLDIGLTKVANACIWWIWMVLETVR